MALVPVEEALARLLENAAPVRDAEEIAIADAEGRILASDLAARLTQPPFDASAMDGYAVIGADVAAAGAELSVIGESAAGRAFAGTVQRGQAVRIFTGAPVPDGADTVLLQEDAERIDGHRIRSTFALQTGRHVRPRGQDFAEGEIVLPAGVELDAGRLLVAAGMNHATLPVRRKPVMALIATGDELRLPGSDLGPSQIVASSTYGVAALARAAGAEVIDFGIVPDYRALISAAIDKARRSKVDVIVTLGGASVGDHDLVQSTMKAAGMQLDFWKIAMRPGKPLMVGSLDGARVLGLPGNPVSTMVCAILFLEPLLRRLSGLMGHDRRTVARSTLPLNANDHRQDYLRATLSIGGDGKLDVSHFGKQDSSLMKLFARADALVIRQPNAPALAAGEEVDILMLRQPGS